MRETKRDRRRYPRVVVALESTVKTACMVWDAKTLNLSPYGVKVRFRQMLQLLPETKVRLHLVLPDQGPSLSLTATVVRVDQDGMVLNFVDPEEQHFERLKAFVDALRAQGEPQNGMVLKA